MKIELNEAQREFPRLVELASQGIDILITIDGTPKVWITSMEEAETKPSASASDRGIKTHEE